MPSIAQIARFAPVARLAGKVRQRLPSGGLSIWLLKAAVRHVSRRKLRARNRSIDPAAWGSMWQRGDFKNWAREPVTGIIEAAGIKLVIDRAEITTGGHVWLDGWALAPKATVIRLDATHCTLTWQAAFATARPDVVQALELSMVERDRNVGFQILARIADYEPGLSRIALTATDGGAVRLVVPVVPEIERSGSMWHSVYDAMRHRSPRDVAYLETSVALLKELRKDDWRHRTVAIRQAIEREMPRRAALKVLLMSRLHPNAAYLNLTMLAATRAQPSDFIVCSMGQHAIQRANEYRSHFTAINRHTAHFLNGEVATPSSEVIEQFVRSCKLRQCPGLIVYDDVAVASAMTSLSEAMRHDATAAVSWRRQFPHASPGELAFAEPLKANDGPGPYWGSVRAMEQQTIGALLCDPTRFEVPSIPPFEGRGHGLEYLLKSALSDAAMAGETTLDLVDPASQREAHALDMLMLLAS